MYSIIVFQYLFRVGVEGGQWSVTDGPCQYLVIIILSYLAQVRGGLWVETLSRRQGSNGDVTDNADVALLTLAWCEAVCLVTMIHP